MEVPCIHFWRSCNGVGFHPMANACHTGSIVNVPLRCRRCQTGHQTAKYRWRCVGDKPEILHYVIRKYPASNTRSDGARRTADLAAQPELGICSERRTGLDPGHPASPVLTWQNLRLGRRFGFGMDTPLCCGKVRTVMPYLLHRLPARTSLVTRSACFRRWHKPPPPESMLGAILLGTLGGLARTTTPELIKSAIIPQAIKILARKQPNLAIHPNPL